MAARADRALCAAQDERAGRHGWTVTRTGFGSRRYRDPRFGPRFGPRRTPRPDALKTAGPGGIRAAGRAPVRGDDQHVPA
ncbi:hypothetical protein FAF44_38900 [Nonomuraea sp. MG754425]|uniref:hypothetical protein n=1 Tax=Nonomuraea sp. MG754425 TaxID=2570319 RepID=UPI001F2BA49A|nr:hypothetical protein [Nonomuraea sp. MG754425]MCF6474307.1 hypothetical protein [Nonomuraea sp. MG754425]